MTEAPERRIARRPQGFMRFVRRQGFDGVYLITAEADKPVKVGITHDPVYRIQQLQIGSFNHLRIRRFWWLPGRRISARIEQAFKDNFESKNIRGEWFDVPLADAERFIEHTIKVLGSWAIKQVHMIELMEHKERRKHQLPAEAPSPLVGLINPKEQGYRGGNIIVPADRTRR